MCGQEHQGPQRLVQGVPGAVAAKVQLLQAGRLIWQLELDLWPSDGHVPFIAGVEQTQRCEMLQSETLSAHDPHRAAFPLGCSFVHNAGSALCAPFLNRSRRIHLQWHRIQDGHDAIC